MWQCLIPTIAGEYNPSDYCLHVIPTEIQIIFSGGN